MTALALSAAPTSRPEAAKGESETLGALSRLRIGTRIAAEFALVTTLMIVILGLCAATREIARNVQDAARGTAEVTRNIIGVIAASDETGAASSQVPAAAEALRRQAEVIRADVDTLLSEVRRG